MSNERQTPEEQREKLRQEELKRSTSSIHGNNAADVVGGLSWKTMGIIILLLIVAGLIYFAFLK